MDTRKAAIVLQAVREGSLSKTAKKLDYSQSALVHLVKSVEQELGVKILKRDNSGVYFTDEGRELAPYLEALVDDERRLKEAAGRILYQRGEELRIVAFPSFSDCISVVLRAIIEEYPNLHMDIKICTTDLEKIVSDGHADIGFASNAFIGENEWVPLAKDRMMCAAHVSLGFQKDAVVPLEELERHPVLISTLSEQNPATQELRKRNVSKMISVSESGASTLFSLVREGIGIAFMSGMFASACPEDVVLFMTDPPLFREIGAISKSFSSMNAAGKRFLTLTQQYFSKEK